MPSKYIIHGAAFCGDGTTSAEAASAGAAGAWNDINIFEGTTPPYGSLGAGDVVYIRSKTSAGADITRTLAANRTLGSASGSRASGPVYWVLDQGTVWSGVVGVLTYTRPAGYTLTFRSYNHFNFTATGACVVTESYLNGTAEIYLAAQAGTVIDYMKVELALAYTSTGPNLMNLNSGSAEPCVLRHCTFRVSSFQSGIAVSAQASAIFINPTIEATIVNPRLSSIFAVSTLGAQLQVVGGRLYGTGATTNERLLSVDQSSGSTEFVGFKFPSDVTAYMRGNNYGNSAPMYITGADGGMGSARISRFGSFDSRQDGYYPYLTAYFPDASSTGWSWKLLADNAGVFAVVELPLVTTNQLSVAAVASVTVELLVGNAWSAVNDKTLWVDLTYIDNATGNPITVTSQGSGGALTSSSAAWSAVTYGAVSLDKKKVSFTTPSSMKPKTNVIATVRCSALSSSLTTHIAFVCPDVVIA